MAHAEGHEVAQGMVRGTGAVGQASGHATGHATGHAAGEVVGHAAGHATGGGSGRAPGHGAGQAHVEGQQHPLGVYFKIWGLLFVLSAASYAVDYFGLQGYLRWTLIVVFMLLKAGLIVAVFMHMVWERLALMYAILVPPLLLLVLLGIGALEADHTFLTRGAFFSPEPAVPARHHP